MKLIVGLGNPGQEYKNTRHNVGFDAVEELARLLDVELNKEKFNAHFAKVDDVIIAKPQTFMNLSGDAVQSIMRFYKIEPEDLLVIYDDMDHGVGKVAIKTTGSAGGQNGVKSIIANAGTQNFARIKIGIGRGNDTVKHVLGNFSKEDRKSIDKVIAHAAKAAKLFMSKDINTVMNKYNIKGKQV
ncbi:aminoacyl-tRNA hydrolase [Mycoplasma marinum]|uniref:Peptidyl-tRNA hydrolase n=1 Tax=Mycoplasma marinum TaxID=1937190 RepID=A0A4R0XUG8_9MOLU|nr:aminoacyl-tRNA hydrolase [Mycoplasma marinum]TCG11437.1 aminoacyl-tRNA hydrolase [Mycoplasma marinum]